MTALESPTPRVHVIIPALDEERTLPAVLHDLNALADLNIIVVDNGSRDRTAAVAAASGATVVAEPERGYGAACLAGLAALADAAARDVVLFLDADGSDDPQIVPSLTKPVVEGDVDLMLASRTLAAGEPGALTFLQRVGNRLACFLISSIWSARFSDLAPCRAVRLQVLRELDMQDRDFGWTVEMQIKVARAGLRFREIPTRYRRRRSGRSKISGTVLGSLRAGATILLVIGHQVIAARPADH